MSPAHPRPTRCEPAGPRAVRRTLPGPRVRHLQRKGAVPYNNSAVSTSWRIWASSPPALCACCRPVTSGCFGLSSRIGFPTGTACPEARYMRASAGVMPKVSLSSGRRLVSRVDNRTSLTHHEKDDANTHRMECYQKRQPQKWTPHGRDIAGVGPCVFVLLKLPLPDYLLDGIEQQEIAGAVGVFGIRSGGCANCWRSHDRASTSGVGHSSRRRPGASSGAPKLDAKVAASHCLPRCVHTATDVFADLRKGRADRHALYELACGCPLPGAHYKGDDEHRYDQRCRRS